MVREPLVAGGFAFTVGVVFAPIEQLFLVAIVILALGILTAFLRLKRGHVPALPFLAATFLLGMWSATVSGRLPDPAPIRAWAFAHAGEPRAVEGVVAESPERTILGTSLVVDLSEPHGRARVTVTSSTCGDVGDRIAGTVSLAPDTTLLAPSFRARSLPIMRGVAVYGRLDGCHVIGPASVRGPLAARMMDPALRAIAVGDRSAVLANGALLSAGQSQLLALGGLTFFALSVALLWTAGLIGRWWLAIPPIVLLALGIGFTPTIDRIALLLGCLCLARIGVGLLSGRQALALGAMVVCGVDPCALGDVAFQLSFASTTALIGLGPVLMVHGRMPRLLAGGVALALGTAPLISRQFDRLSPLGLAADAITLPLTVVAGTAALIHETLGKPIFDLVLSIVARLPPGTLSTPSVLECVLAYAALAAASAEKLTRRSTGAFFFMLVALILVAGAPRLEARLIPKVRVSVLPVASGHAVLIEDAEGRVLLEGVGGYNPDPEAHARLISSVLRARRIFALDAVVVTSTGSATEAILARSHDFTRRMVADPRAVTIGARTLYIDGGTITSPPDLVIAVEPSWAATSSAAWSTGRSGMIVLDGAFAPKAYLSVP